MKPPNENALAGGTAQGAETASLDGLPQHGTTRRLMPKPDTTRARILEEFRAGRSLTALQAWHRHGAARLAADVYVLRRMGWPIIGTETLVPSRHGHASRIVTYRLAAGEQEQEHGQ